MRSLARRLDPCANWFRLLARTHGRILWLFPASLGALYLAAVLGGGSPFAGFVERFSERRVHVVELDEARRLSLGYETVAARPAAYAGKPVVWCVDSFNGKSGFVDGRQTLPIVWTEPSPSLKSSPGAHGYCWKVLAVVVGSERGAVSLRPVEKL